MINGADMLGPHKPGHDFLSKAVLKLTNTGKNDMYSL